MKTIRVVAAVIVREKNNQKQIFATQRGYGELKGGWEFPGGKIEAGETPQDALIREINEEMLESCLIRSNMIILSFICRWIVSCVNWQQIIWS